MKPLGDGFVKLIKMIIAPVIFCTVVTGIAGMESMKAVSYTHLYNLIILGGAVAVSVESKQVRRSHRVELTITGIP